jgi:predicted CXXCH cytochrome family protein
MKKIIVAIAFAAYASIASAAISASKHDFTVGYGSATTTETQSCKFCHAPHGSNDAYSVVALWNRASNLSASYTTYSTAGVPAGDITLSNNTRACLSCHDGSVTIGQVYNNGTPATLFSALVGITNLANLGVTLANDHPVDMVYAGGTGYAAITAGTPSTVAGMPLGSGDRMMCTTCHDVHDAAVGGFPFMLRADPAGSAICIACHTNK